MGKPLVNPNAIQVHTYLPTALRADLAYLATLPGFTESRTQAELFTRIMLSFLCERPWVGRAPEEFWQRGSAHYVIRDGVREPSPDWGEEKVRIHDITFKSVTYSAQTIHKEMERVASMHVPKRSSRDGGMASLIYTAMIWATATIMSPKRYPRPTASDPFAHINVARLAAPQRVAHGEALGAANEEVMVRRRRRAP